MKTEMDVRLALVKRQAIILVGCAMLCGCLTQETLGQKVLVPTPTTSGSDCTLEEVASARYIGFIPMPNGESRETLEWTFCDGTSVVETFIGSEMENEFRDELTRETKKIPLQKEVSRVEKDGRIRILFAAKHGGEWTLFTHIGSRSSVLRGKSILHILLLERLRQCKL